MDAGNYGIDFPTVERIATEVKAVCDMGVVIFSGAYRHLPQAWNGLPLTTWGCWPRS